MSTNKEKKSQPIKVFVRIRPLSESEIKAGDLNVLKIENKMDLTLRDSIHNKKFNFDRVFDTKSTQIDVYETVLESVIPEVIAGYNCTVFAYGQTGSGKTYTVTGNRPDPTVSWQNDPFIGLIPRASINLFKEIRKMNTNYVDIYVTFLELYNEELRDLLSEDNKELKLLDTKAGSVTVIGAKEVTVHNEEDVYKLLKQGSDKRQTASTLMNSSSSRSHSVFTINLSLKLMSANTEVCIKKGKLHLVDLAGSENINRSGAKDMRAREAGNINQSLLTLGRVIKALVESSKYIPYRDSKLTRILKDSLGGNTKTSIIANVTPSSRSVEETVSTLEYASRARNIKNCPQVNENVSVTNVLKGIQTEILQLEKNLKAMREGKGGFFMDYDNYNNLLNTNEIQKRKQIEYKNCVHELEENLRQLKNDVSQKEEEYNKLLKHMEETNLNLENVKKQADECKNNAQLEYYIISNFQEIYEKAQKQIIEFITAIQVFSKHSNVLQEKIDTLYQKSFKNEQLSKNSLEIIKNTLNNSLIIIKDHETDYKKIKTKIHELINNMEIKHQESLGEIKKSLFSITSAVNEFIISGDQNSLEQSCDQLNNNFITSFKSVSLSENDIIGLFEILDNIKRILHEDVKVQSDEECHKIKMVLQKLFDYLLTYKTCNQKFIKSIQKHNKGMLDEFNKFNIDRKNDKFDEAMKNMEKQFNSFKKRMEKRQEDTDKAINKVDDMQVTFNNDMKKLKDACLKYEGEVNNLSKQGDTFLKKVDSQMIVRDVAISGSLNSVAEEISDGQQRILNSGLYILTSTIGAVDNYTQKINKMIERQKEIIQKFATDIDGQLKNCVPEVQFNFKTLKDEMEIMEQNTLTLISEIKNVSNVSEEIKETFRFQWEKNE